MPILVPGQLDPLEVHEIPSEFDADELDAFIEFTKQSGGAELANAQAIVSGATPGIAGRRGESVAIIAGHQ